MVMGSLLGPVLAVTFTVELEITALATLNEHMTPWKVYVDDTISYIICNIFLMFNMFYQN